MAGSMWRLIGAGWTLVRADALVPREIAPLLPPNARFAAGVLRVFAGRAARQGRPGERLALAMERLGPVAIKLGQLLSTRADIFGGEFAEDLSRLKDRLAPFDEAVARRAAEQALGKPLDTVFAAFGPVVGSASLAQAHRVTLLDGREAAVKILRPGIEARVAAEVATMNLAARLVERWVPASRRLEPRAFTAEVARSLQLELDLRFEAAGADELRQVMAVETYMRAPAVVWEGVAKRMLTLEWAPGVALSDPASLEQPGLDRPTAANNVLRAFLAQALDHGVFHADLHEGNLFLAAPASLTAVDFGIIGRLSAGQRRYLADILWGFLQRDYDRVAAVHFEAGFVPAHHDRAAFAQALRAVGEPVFGRRAKEVSMGRLLAQLFEITALFDMRLRPELVLLQKTMVTVEGVARRIDPEHDIWTAADPIVRRWIARELNPATQAKAVLEEVRGAARNLARLIEKLAEPVPPAPPPVERRRRWPWAVLGLLAGAGATYAAWALHLFG